MKSQRDVSRRKYWNTPINETERSQMSGSALSSGNLSLVQNPADSGKCVKLVVDRKILQDIKGKDKFLLSGMTL